MRLNTDGFFLIFNILNKLNNFFFNLCKKLINTKICVNYHFYLFLIVKALIFKILHIRTTTHTAV